MRLRFKALAALALAGCGAAADGLPRQPVAGTVTVDGRPLPTGMITFAPLDGSEPVVTATIAEGSYALPKAEGPVPGGHRVSIWAKAGTGRQVKDPHDPETLIEERVDLVPTHYNFNSAMTAEVKADATNTFDFPLSGAKVAGGAKGARR